MKKITLHKNKRYVMYHYVLGFCNGNNIDSVYIKMKLKDRSSIYICHLIIKEDKVYRLCDNEMIFGTKIGILNLEKQIYDKGFKETFSIICEWTDNLFGFTKE